MKQINYTARDYHSIKQELLELSTLLLPEWNNKSETDLGVILIDLFAYSHDILNYYIDRMVNEMYLPTCQLRTSAQNILDLVGYKLKSATGSTSYLVFGVTPQTNDVIIPKGFKVSTKPTEEIPAYIFETTENLVIPSGEKGFSLIKNIFTETNRIKIEDTPNNNIYNIGDKIFIYTPHNKLGQGLFKIKDILNISDGVVLELEEPINFNIIEVNDSWISKRFVLASQGETKNTIAGASSGEENQSFILSYKNYLEGSMNVIVSYNGIEESWSLVDSLFYYGATDKVFSVQVDDEFFPSIIFGDGVNGMIPPQGSLIKCSYKIGGGKSTNVASGTITEFISNLSVASFVVNPINAFGGDDPENIDLARKLAPLKVQSNDRCVTFNDYEYFIKSFISSTGENAKKIKFFVSSWNLLEIYVGTLDTDGNVVSLSDDYKTELKTFLDSKSMFGVTNEIKDPEYRYINIDVEIKVKENYAFNDVKNNVLKSINNYFSESQEFKSVLYLSSLYDYIAETEGLLYCIITKFYPEDDQSSFLWPYISLSEYQFPKKLNINILEIT